MQKQQIQLIWLPLRVWEVCSGPLKSFVLCLANKWVGRRLSFTSPRMCPFALKGSCCTNLVSSKWSPWVAIWGCLLLAEHQKGRPSNILLTWLQLSCQDGRLTNCPSRGASRWPNQWLRPSPSIQWCPLWFPKRACRRSNACNAPSSGGDQGNSRKAHMLNWQVLQLTKNMGGLAMRDLSVMYEACLMKFAWGLRYNAPTL